MTPVSKSNAARVWVVVSRVRRHPQAQTLLTAMPRFRNDAPMAQTQTLVRRFSFVVAT